MTSFGPVLRMMLKIFQINLSVRSLATILCLPLVLQIACSSRSSANNQQKQAVPVKAAKATIRDMPVEIKTIGNIESVLGVAIRSQVTGRLLKVNFKEGDLVKKGQLLFTLDSRPFIEAVRQAEAALAQSNAGYRVALANLSNAQAQMSGARSNVQNQHAGVRSAEGNLNSLKAQSDDALSLEKKQQTLFAEGIIAERDLEVAETNYKSARAKYEQAAALVNQAEVSERSASDAGIGQAQAVIEQMRSQIQVAQAQVAQSQAALDDAKVQLSYCQITSPIDGRTGGLGVTEGNLITPGDTTPIVTINSMSPIYATFTVPEKYLSDIQRYSAQGAVQVTAQIDADTSRGGTLTLLNNEVSQMTGTVQLKASFINDDGLLYPGRFVNIVLTLTNQTDALVVPANAVQTSQQGQFVYVVKDDQTVEMRKVSLDRTIGDDAVISDGLSEGELVVTDGQMKVGPGAAVQVTLEGPGGPETQSILNGSG